MRLLLTTLLFFIAQALYSQKDHKELQSNEKFKWLVDSVSPRLSIYYQTDNLIFSRIASVRGKVLNQIDSVEKFMRIEPYKPRIHLFVVNSKQQMKDLVGWETNGTGFYKENVVTGIASESVWSIYSTHEFFHIIAMNLWGIPDVWLNEGMAVYAEKKWLNYYDLYQLTKFLVDNGRYISIEKLIKRFRNEDSMISYPLLGSFVKYLDETYGRELIIKIWSGGTKELKKATKRSIEELENDWLIKVKQVTYENIKY